LAGALEALPMPDYCRLGGGLMSLVCRSVVAELSLSCRPDVCVAYQFETLCDCYLANNRRLGLTSSRIQASVFRARLLQAKQTIIAWQERGRLMSSGAFAVAIAGCRLPLPQAVPIGVRSFAR
jgi:hypothetical protein